MKVALAIDGSSCSLRATRFLIGLISGREGTEVHVVNVQPPIRYADLLPLETQQLVEQWSRESGENATAAARELLAAAAIPCHLHVVVGDPASAIVKLARGTELRSDRHGHAGHGGGCGLGSRIRRHQGGPSCGHTSHVGEVTAILGASSMKRSVPLARFHDLPT